MTNFSINKSFSPRTILTIFKVIGSFLLVLSIFLAWKQYKFINKAEKTVGTVTFLEEEQSTSSKSKRSDLVYYPVVKFIDKKGTEISFKSSTGSNPASFYVGEQLTIYYDVNNSNNAEIATFGNLWILPLILGFIAIVFLGITFFL